MFRPAVPARALLAASALALPLLAQTSRTYTTTSDFAEGVQVNVNATVVANQLQLNQPGATAPLPLVAIAASGRGTLVRIDTVSGAVLGEYATAPDGFGRNPSRTSVDRFGNVWVGNRDEAGQPTPARRNKGSVAKIGVCIGGTRVDANGNPDPDGQYRKGPFLYNTCVDRDGDGLIRTSRGLGDVLAWPNVTDGAGGANGIVEDALDEAILLYQRTSGIEVRHVSVDANDDAWVGGYPSAPTRFDLVSGVDGAILQSFTAPGCGGHGGVFDGAGVLWSTSLAEATVLRYETGNGSSSCIPALDPHGMGIGADGHVWVAEFQADRVTEILPDGTVAGSFPTGGGIFDRSVCVTPIDNDVWVGNSASNTVSRLDVHGPEPLKIIDLGFDGQNPRGVSVDAEGKVWVSCLDSSTVKRIDPDGGFDGRGAVDLTIDLGIGANPYNFGDMTGLTPLLVTNPSGFWQVLYDSQAAGNEYGRIAWNAAVPQGTELKVEFRASDDPVAIQSLPFQLAQNGVSFSGVFGRYVDVRVGFRRPASTTLSPVLFDLTIEGLGGGGGGECPSGARTPASLLVFPEFDNRYFDATLLTVTNTQSSGSNVAVEFVYVGKVGHDGEDLDCLEFNRTHVLTPNDTLSVLTRAHNPSQAQGFVYVFAKSVATGAAIVHDHLIGQALVINGIESVSYAYDPYTFRGVPAPGAPTDLDGDGARDLNGLEYTCAPDVIHVPRFIAVPDEPHGKMDYVSFLTGELVLVNLTGGARFDATVDFLIYNDNEEAFSAETTFRCWTKRPLLSISQAFGANFLASTAQNPAEVLGAPWLEAGWFQMDGSVASSPAASFEDPAILALYVEGSLVGRTSADLPFETGSQTNGDLYLRGVFGDTTP